MSSLVLELQREAMGDDASVSLVLRKALVVATKLDVPEFRMLCESELRGFGVDDKLPDYRHVGGQVKAYNPYQGWQPVIFENPDHERALSRGGVVQSISELEDLLRNVESGGVLQMPISAEVLKLFLDSGSMRAGLIPTVVISPSSIRGIVERVRNLVLEWSLALEKDGILGENMTFSDEEKQAAASTIYNIETVTGIVGGTVNANSITIRSYSEIEGDLQRIGVDQEQRDELKAIMDELSGADDERKPSLLEAGREWVNRNKSALGLLAQVLVGWFNAQA